MLIFGWRVETYESFPTVWFVMLSGTSWTLGREREVLLVCVWEGHFGLVPSGKGY